MTTHIVNDLDKLLDEIIIMQKNEAPLKMSYLKFRDIFKGYILEKGANLSEISCIISVNDIANFVEIYGSYLAHQTELNLSFEYAFWNMLGDIDD